LLCLLVLFGASPQRVLVVQQQNLQQVNLALQLTEQQQYQEAMNALDKVQNFDSLLANFKNRELQNLLKQYKRILLEQVSQVMEQKNFKHARNLLNSKLRYHKTDSAFTNLLSLCNQELTNQVLAPCKTPPMALFVNSLLSYESVALNPNNPYFTELETNHLTPTEFERVLYELYQNNYVLVDASYSDTTQPLLLPSGKKPLTLLFDNIGHSEPEIGLVDKVILDRNDTIATYTGKKSIHERVSYDNEYITVLENFLQYYPEFSQNNARGTIFVSTSDRILGYKTQKSNATSKYEIKKATQVATKLKALGWKFGYSVNNHKTLNQMSDIEFTKKISKWKNELESVVGKSNLCLLPSDTQFEESEFAYKRDLLLESGFTLFFSEHYKQPNNTTGTFTVSNFFVVSGKALREQKTQFKPFFVAEHVYDYHNRNVPFVSPTVSLVA